MVISGKASHWAHLERKLAPLFQVVSRFGISLAVRGATQPKRTGPACKAREGEKSKGLMRSNSRHRQAHGNVNFPKGMGMFMCMIWYDPMHHMGVFSFSGLRHQT